jgi:hypothetical protein
MDEGSGRRQTLTTMPSAMNPFHTIAGLPVTSIRLSTSSWQALPRPDEDEATATRDSVFGD